ncbi:hypothetical protein HN031_03260 [Nocardioides sp. zg-1308]|uniref:hypothetical protein n=1 Tax=Nocardioides sp. zg-1308 TaxID=2736253 RepID=UPI00155308B0|nr:hypothetical protein [Nocardioides sp. zg-1308]NPD03700.1 hypothetical protein [Nocardioides sp. zg-1308]
MTRPAVVGFAGREKWGEVLVDLVLAGLGGLLVAVAAPELSAGAPPALWLVVLYTTFAVAATVLLAVVVTTTSRLPTIGEGTVAGRPAVGLRSWAAPWWHANALDLGLAATGLALLAAGLAEGGSWAVVGAVPGLVGLWFAARVALVVLGRRRRPALWLTPDEVVADSPVGRARAARGSVRRVRSSGRRVVVDLDDDATWFACPRPWRRRAPSARVLVLDAEDVGHRPAEVADWLRSELDLADRTGRIGTSRTGEGGQRATPRPPHHHHVQE